MFLQIICITLLFFISENYVINKFNLNLDILNKLNSSFHGLVMVIGSSYYLIDLIDKDKLNYYLYFSSGYALYDIVNLYNMNYKSRYSLTIHHLIIIFGNYYVIIENNNHLYFILTLNYLSEISTYFLNNVLYMYENKITNNKFFKFNCYGLLGTYIIFRLFSGILALSYMIYYNTGYLLFQITMTTMNFIWFSKLLKKFKKIKS